MFDLKKFLLSFSYAFQGIVYALKNNQNLRIHFIIALLVIIASIMLHITGFEMGIIGVMILLVISAEMINTAIEQMVDFLVNEHRKEAKNAKDMAAGMVLVTAFGSVIVGILIFAPHIFKLFR